MLKTRTKLIITFAIMAFAMCLLNVNSVNAEVTTEEAQKMLDLVPNEITVDIPEIEYEKANELIKTQIIQIWNENNMNRNDIELSISVGGYNTIDSFYKASVRIERKEGNINIAIANKDVQIIFNNTNKGISADEQYVKNLQLENPKVIEMELDYALKHKNNIWEWFENYIANYYEQKINDNSVKISTFVGAGVLEGVNLNTSEGGTWLRIFKNGKLYDIRHIGEMTVIPVVTVDSNMTEQEVKDYVINLIKSTYIDYGKYIINIDKGVSSDWSNEMYLEELGIRDIADLYTINTSIEAPMSFIIIRRNSNTIIVTDENTNVKLEASSAIIPQNTELKVTPILEGESYNRIKNVLTNVNKFVAFDISLLSDGIEIQPNGNVKISIPIPEGYNISKLAIYRIEENGTKIEYAVNVVTIDDKQYAQFETNHFSDYVLAEQEITVGTQSEQERQKDDTPKTGRTSIINCVLIITVIAIIAIILIKKKLK